MKYLILLMTVFLIGCGPKIRDNPVIPISKTPIGQIKDANVVFVNDYESTSVTVVKTEFRSVVLYGIVGDITFGQEAFVIVGSDGQKWLSLKVS